MVIIAFMCDNGSGFVELKFAGPRILGAGLSGFVGKFNCEEAVSADRYVVGVARDPEGTLGPVGVVLTDLDTSAVIAFPGCEIIAYGRILDLKIEYFIKGLAG